MPNYPTVDQKKSQPSFPQKMGFLDFLKKAWQDTFLRSISVKERDTYHLGHYFFGWPKKGSKAAYFITAKFLTTPLFNLFSLFIELPLNLLSESFSFLKNEINSWMPTHGITQVIRDFLLGSTLGIQTFFKGLYYLVRMVTSPLRNYQEAKQKHPALGVLSALASIILIGGILATLAVFAAPIFAAIAPTLGPTASTIINALATPILELLAVISVSLSTTTAAMFTVISSIVLGSFFHLIGRKTIYPEENKPKDEEQSTLGSNVGALLPSEHSSEESDTNAPPISQPQGQTNGSKTDMLQGSFGRLPRVGADIITTENKEIPIDPSISNNFEIK